jgi:hypothetical protein
LFTTEQQRAPAFHNGIMDSINTASNVTELPISAGKTDKRPASDFEMDDGDDAVRKVEEANTPSKQAQQGVQKVEAVTLTWTKTSLALAFIW